MRARFDGTSRFEIVRQLGAGGFGVVFEAIDRERNVRVALKTLSQLDAASLFRFKREFRIFADLHHENLVKLYELVSEGDQWFFTMELVEGVDWRAHVVGEAPRVTARSSHEDAPTLEASWESAALAASRGVTGGDADLGATRSVLPASLDRLRASLIQVVQGLDALHRAGSCHRDIKPSNILVTGAGRAVILDFGIATSESKDATAGEMHGIAGTPAYMAPEQIMSSAVTPAADWYAMGVMLYEALTGHPPFTGSLLQILGDKQTQVPRRPTEIAPQTPQDLDQLCMDLLQIDPALRPGVPRILATLGAPPDSPAARAPAAGGASLFVGREELLEQLAQAYESSRQGALNLVFLQGTSGMGKSTLVRTFLRRAEGRPVVFEGRCLQRESVPYKALDEVIDALSKHLLGLPREEAALLMPRDAAALARIFPVLDRVPVIAESPRRAADLRDPFQVRSRAFGALREMLGRLGDRRPVVIFLDDIQWGDADSAGLIAELVAPPDPPPALFILCFRAEEAPTSALLNELKRRLEVVGLGGREHRLNLGNLSLDQALSLARRLLGDDDHERAAVIARESAGSPFFLGELAQYARTEEGQRDTGELRLDDVIQRRVSQLPPAARTALRVVSIAGNSLDRRVVLRAGAFDEEPLASALQTLRLANLIKLRGARGERVEPFHDKIREAVVDSLRPEEKTALHRDLAHALDATDADPETLLVHFRAGGEIERTRQLVRVAAERSTSALAFDRAAELWQEALALGGWDEQERRTLGLARAEALARAGRGTRAAAAYLSLAEDQPPMEALELRRRAGEELLLAGEIAAGTEVTRQVLAAVDLAPPPGTIRLILGLLVTTLRVELLGRRQPPREPPRLTTREQVRLDVCASCAKAFTIVEVLLGLYFSQLVALYALQSRSTYHLALARIGRAGHIALAGTHRLDEALTMMDQAVELAASDPRADEVRRIAALGAGVTLSLLGHLKASTVKLDEVMSSTQHTGGATQWDLDTAMYVSMLSWARLGQFNEVASRLSRYLRDAVNRGDLYLSTMLRVGDGSILWMVRDTPDEGQADVEHALSQWARPSFDTAGWLGQCSLAALDQYRGRHEQALARTRSLIETLRWSRIRAVRTMWSLTHLHATRSAVACLADAPDDPGRGRLAASLLRQARRFAPVFHLPLWHLFRAGHAWLCGQREESLAALAEGHAAATRLEMVHYRAFCRLRRGQLIGGDEGTALITEGVAWMRSEGVVNPSRFLQSHSPGFPALDAVSQPRDPGGS